jgi:hypothetical protein
MGTGMASCKTIVEAVNDSFLKHIKKRMKKIVLKIMDQEQ